MKKLILMVFLMGLFLYPLQGFSERVIAEIGPYKLTEKELQKMMNDDPQVREILKANPQLKSQVERALIERWINISLLALSAQEAGLKEDPEVKVSLLEAEKRILAEALLQKRLSQLNVTEEELKSCYEKNKEKYKVPEGVKLRHILIYVPKEADEKTKEKALVKARQIRNQLLKGAKFEELAKIYSDDTASREKGGDLGILRKGETIPEFEKEVFKLKPGEISQPIKSVYGYHLVKVEKKLPEEILPFEKVKEEVKEDLRKEKERKEIEALLKELQQKYQPKIYLDTSSEGKDKAS